MLAEGIVTELSERSEEFVIAAYICSQFGVFVGVNRHDYVVWVCSSRTEEAEDIPGVTPAARPRPQSRCSGGVTRSHTPSAENWPRSHSSLPTLTSFSFLRPLLSAASTMRTG